MKKIESGKNYTRYALGTLAVVALRDGYVDLPTNRLRQSGDRDFGAELPPQVQLVGGKLRLSVNAFLVIDNSEHVLIDTGAANSWEPTMGLLPDALAEAGIDRNLITTVALTHTHEDHAHGLVAADDSDSFPELARLYVPQEEIQLFDGNERVARFRGRRTPFLDGQQIGPNITARAAHGHEVGHTAYEVSSAGETVFIWGDIVHVPSIQFARPEVTWGFDTNQDQAGATRLRMLNHVARFGHHVAGAHLDFPGVGAVAKRGDGFSFQPA
ncbi:MAG: MBL fold metallo-hydrolase [Rhizobiales bacterium]|nr:MBL fold metallo-hydrolase [Hyphomicrobiales bacterium]